MNSLRIRILLAAILLAVTLAGCVVTYGIESGVSYVPGHGYVVKVEKVTPEGAYSPYSRSDYYYYVFNTEADAKRFMDTIRADRKARIAEEHQPRYRKGTPEYFQIACTTGVESGPVCSLPGQVNRSLDRVTPPIPTGPAPR